MFSRPPLLALRLIPNLVLTALGLAGAWQLASTASLGHEGQDPPPITTDGFETTAVFETIDLYLDPGKEPIAAYQIEFIDRSGGLTIVGIEGGEHPAFREPPHYDPAALRRNRVILAAYQLNEELPSTRTRVATLHCMRSTETEPEFAIELQVAASRDGKPMNTTTRLDFEVRKP